MLITNRYVANKNIFVGVGIQHEYHIGETWGYKTRSVYNKKKSIRTGPFIIREFDCLFLVLSLFGTMSVVFVAIV
jgi:hypothetical protein